PDIVGVMTENTLAQSIKGKLALIYEVTTYAVIESRDVETLYTIPISLQEQKMDQIVLDYFGLDLHEADMTGWRELEQRVLHLENKVKIGLVGKYVELPDAYLSVVEALKHAGFYHNSDIELSWINAEDINADNVDSYLKDVDGIL